jgi:hypothetical protein
MDNSQHPTIFTRKYEALLDENRCYCPPFLPRFSDLESEDLALLSDAWPRIHPDRRLALLLELKQLAEIDTLVNFDEVGEFALDDPDPRVRTAAVVCCGKIKDPHLIPRLYAT